MEDMEEPKDLIKSIYETVKVRVRIGGRRSKYSMKKSIKQ